MVNIPTQLIRFFVVALIGLAIDIAVAWWCIVTFDCSDPVAAAFGLFAGMVFNYFAHLKWTFRDYSQSATLIQFTKFAGTVSLTLLIRVIVLEVLNRLALQEVIHPAIRLFFSASIAFLFSYFLCRRVVYGRQLPAEGAGNQ